MAKVDDIAAQQYLHPVKQVEGKLHHSIVSKGSLCLIFLTLQYPQHMHNTLRN